MKINNLDTLTKKVFKDFTKFLKKTLYLDIHLEFEGEKIYISLYSLDKYLAMKSIIKNKKI